MQFEAIKHNNNLFQVPFSQHFGTLFVLLLVFSTQSNQA